MKWFLWAWMTVGAQADWFPLPQAFDTQDDCIVAGIVMDQKQNGHFHFDCRREPRNRPEE